MEYILFDDCYMSSIEVAYELKDVTKYLIGSTSEMMAYGMPYAAIGEYLLGNPDYQSDVKNFTILFTYEIMALWDISSNGLFRTGEYGSHHKKYQ